MSAGQSFRILALCWSLVFSSSVYVSGDDGGETPTVGQLTIDHNILRMPPAGVRLGQGVSLQTADEHVGLSFQDAAGIELPLDGILTAASGTVAVFCQVADDWPSTSRQTLLHIGEQSHVHVTLFANGGQLIAVYKAGEEHYAAIQFREATNWKPGSWHDVTFSWLAESQQVSFYLEVDGRMVGRQKGQLITAWPERGYVGVRRHGQAWQGVISRMSLSSNFSLPQELRSGHRTIVINSDQLKGPCYNFWSINNFTSQHMFAEPQVGLQLRRDKPFMKYVNCVRLLGGRHDGLNEWYQGLDENGAPRCDFSKMIQYLRGIQAAGYTPRIVLDNIPTAMSKPGELAKYGNTRPAEDLHVWHAYITQVVSAMVDAFGLEEVAQWRFRVGTEPDLNPGHWQGSREEYLRHYDCTVDAVCSTIPDADIGPGNILNPAYQYRVNGVGEQAWGLDIVDHCAAGTNTWTGDQGTRICFLECSWYGQVGRSIDSLDVAIQKMRDRLEKHHLADLPISIAEFAVLQDENNVRLFGGDSTEWAASWYAAVADRVYDLNVRQVHEWSIATAGLLHPRAHVMAMLEMMQDGQRLDVTVNGNSAARAGAISCLKDGSYYILLYNHRPWRTPSITERIDLRIRAAAFQEHDQWNVHRVQVDREHGVFIHQLYDDFQQAGIPVLPEAPIYGGNLGLRFEAPWRDVFAKHRAKYASLAIAPEFEPFGVSTVAGGELAMSFSLPGHSVWLLVMTPKSGISRSSISIGPMKRRPSY